MQQINVRTLFLAACAIKLAALAIAFFLHDIYFFGVLLPLFVMVAYCFIGWRYREKDVSDEKFADSCYYLGFIFTIATILLILLDLEAIDSDLSSIAARFGAAMLTTLIGVIARVVIIGFKKEAADRMDDVENQLLLSAEKMVGQMQLAADNFAHLAQEIALNAENCRHQLETSIEGIGKSYADQAKQFFDELAQQYRLNTDDIVEANKKLAKSINGLLKNTESLQQNLDFFGTMLNRQNELLEKTDLRPALAAIESGYRQFNHTLGLQSDNQQALAQSVSLLKNTVEQGLNNFAALSNDAKQLQQGLASMKQEIPALTNALQQLSQKNPDHLEQMDILKQKVISIHTLLFNQHYQPTLDSIEKQLKEMLALFQSEKKGFWNSWFRSGEKQ